MIRLKRSQELALIDVGLQEVLRALTSRKPSHVIERVVVPKLDQFVPAKRGRKKMTPKQRKAVSRRMKAMWAAKRGEK